MVSRANCNTLVVPCQVSKGKDVEIFLDELLEANLDDVLDLLRAEMAPLKVFRRLAVRHVFLIVLLANVDVLPLSIRSIPLE
jgi:hypothetical protein